MEAHPGIVFRDGPSGRRAGTAAGPDVWAVVSLLLGLRGSFEERGAAAATQAGLTEGQVRTTSADRCLCCAPQRVRLDAQRCRVVRMVARANRPTNLVRIVLVDYYTV